VGDSKVQIPDEWFEADSSSDESQIISKHERSHRRHNSKDVDAPVIDLLRCSDRQIGRLERRFHNDKGFRVSVLRVCEEDLDLSKSRHKTWR
jgi:hypothetical protein